MLPLGAVSVPAYSVWDITHLYSLKYLWTPTYHTPTSILCYIWMEKQGMGTLSMSYLFCSWAWSIISHLILTHILKHKVTNNFKTVMGEHITESEAFLGMNSRDTAQILYPRSVICWQHPVLLEWIPYNICNIIVMKLFNICQDTNYMRAAISYFSVSKYF